MNDILEVLFSETEPNVFNEVAINVIKELRGSERNKNNG